MAADCLCASALNRRERTSGTQIWIGRRPCFRRRSRCARTLSRDSMGADQYETLARAQSRIGSHFAADGSQPHELQRKTTQHYCCFNLQSWINLSELAMRWNVNFWTYEPPGGGSLERGIRWFLGFRQSRWPFPQKDAFDQDRFLPIWFAARDRIGDLDPTGLSETAYEAKPLFHPHDGVRPFWNIGSFGSP